MGEPAVRVMREADIPFATALTDTEDWGYTAADLHRLLALEPEGCLVVEADGRPAGLTAVVTYGEVAWLGAVIVLPELRDRGLGERLLHSALEFCESRGVRSVRLNAYLHAEEFYQRLGFRGETENVRLRAAAVRGFSGGRAGRGDASSLAAFDARYFGASRERLLRRLGGEPGGFLLAVDRGGETLGYIAGTVDGSHCEIGPWVVEPGEPVAAATLLEEALGLEGVTSAGLTVPLVNHPAVEAVEAAGFREAFRTVRMTRGDPAAEDPRGLWALGGLEKG